MYVIIENSEAEIVIKKSKFIAHTFKIESKEQAEEILQKNKKKYFDAKHNCYAYRIIQKDCSILEKSSDDGEPSKTAGSPMLDILKGKELVNVLVIVTRYFGGILLGTGGLVRAYSDACSLAIEKSKMREAKIVNKYEAEISYQDLKKLKYLCEKENIKTENETYNQNITIEIYAAEKEMQTLASSIDFLKLEKIETNLILPILWNYFQKSLAKFNKLLYNFGRNYKCICKKCWKDIKNA